MIRRMMPRLYRSPAALFIALVACLLLWLVLRTTPISAIWASVQRLTIDRLFVLVVVNVLVFWTFAGRWWLFLRAQGYTIAYRKLLAYRLTTFSISYFTPGPHFGGEPYQVYATVRWHDVPRPASIAAVTLDKLFELLFNFTFLLASLLLSLQHQRPEGPLNIQGIVVACLMLVAPALLLLGWFRQKHPLTALVRQLTRIVSPAVLATVYTSEEQAIWLCRRAPGTCLLAVGITLLSWAGMVGEYWLLTLLLDFELLLPQAISAFLAARIAILLPMPAGLGALEASQVFALTGLGLTPAAGIALSLVIRLRDVILGIAGLWLGGQKIWEDGELAPVDIPAGMEETPLPGTLEPGLVQIGEIQGVHDK